MDISKILYNLNNGNCNHEEQVLMRKYIRYLETQTTHERKVYTQDEWMKLMRDSFDEANVPDSR